jgi:hypothetical protein
MTTTPVPSPGDLQDAFLRQLATVTDLSAGLTFRRDAAGCMVKSAGSAEWTNILLNILLEMGAACGFEVYPRRKYFVRRGQTKSGDTVRRGYAKNCDYDRPPQPDDRGEWLLDACWTRYPAQQAWVERLRREPGVQHSGILLACESEWASSQFGQLDPDAHVSAVLDDFAKLVDIRASLKVLFFSFQPKAEGVANFDDIVSLCRVVASPVAATEHYLLFGWPYTATWPERITTLRAASLGPASDTEHSTGTIPSSDATPNPTRSPSPVD